MKVKKHNKVVESAASHSDDTALDLEATIPETKNKKKKEKECVEKPSPPISEGKAKESSLLKLDYFNKCGRGDSADRFNWFFISFVMTHCPWNNAPHRLIHAFFVRMSLCVRPRLRCGFLIS